MDYRPLGNSGLRVSVVGLGCSNFGVRVDDATARQVLHRALDLGVTLLDTADVYGGRGGSEAFLGRALGARRKDVILATKFGRPMREGGRSIDASRRHIMTAVEDSLRRLNTDWIDLYQLHWPDPDTPVEETLRALEDLRVQGKIRCAGASNLPAAQMLEAAAAARTGGMAGFVSCQHEYSLLVRDAERELIPALRAQGAVSLAYLPLASGFLSGKYRRGAPAPERARLAAGSIAKDAAAHDWAQRFLTAEMWTALERLEKLAASQGRSLVELALGWVAARDNVASVLTGATSAEQVAANVAAITRKPAPEELAALDRALAD